MTAAFRTSSSQRAGLKPAPCMLLFKSISRVQQTMWTLALAVVFPVLALWWQPVKGRLRAQRTLVRQGLFETIDGLKVDVVGLQPCPAALAFAPRGFCDLTGRQLWRALLLLCRGCRPASRTAGADPVSRSAPRLLHLIAWRIQGVARDARHPASQGREDGGARSGNRWSQSHRSPRRPA